MLVVEVPLDPTHEHYPLATSLVSGSGHSFYFAPADGPVDHYAINLSTLQRAPNVSYDGWTEFTLEFFYKPEGAVSQVRALFSATDTPPGETGTTSLNVSVNGVSSGGSITAQIRIGGVLKTLSSSDGVITTGSIHHVAISYNGSTVRLLVDGVSRASASASGTVGQGDHEHLIVGQLFTGYYETYRGQAGPRGWIDSVRISDHGRYTGDFVAPTVKHSADAYTRLLLNFESEQDGVTPWVIGHSYFGGAPDRDHYFVVKDQFLVDGTPEGFELEGVRFASESGHGGIYATNVRHTMFRDISMQGLSTGIVLQNNVYTAKLENISISAAGGETGIIMANTAGVGYMHGISISGYNIGVYGFTGADYLDQVWIATPVRAGVWLQGDIGTNISQSRLTNVIIGDEGGSDLTEAAIVLDSMGSVVMDSPAVILLSSTVPSISVRGQRSTALLINGGTFGNPEGAYQRIHFASRDAGNALVASPNFFSGAEVQWTDGDGGVVRVVSHVAD